MQGLSCSNDQRWFEGGLTIGSPKCIELRQNGTDLSQSHEVLHARG